MTVILFLVILALLIAVHEFGHFIVAKKSGIRVDEFALGFPPKIISKKIGETNYALNLIPFGGYVKIFGEDPDEESMNGPDKARSFVNQSKGTQALVLVAGVTFNMLLAWVFITGSLLLGVKTSQEVAPEALKPYITENKLLLTSIAPDSPALRAGLHSGDELLSLSAGVDVLAKTAEKDTSTITPEEVTAFVQKHGTEDISLSIIRDGKAETIHATPSEEVKKGTPTIGFSMAVAGTLKLPFFKGLYYGVQQTWESTVLVVSGLYHFLTGIFTFKADFSQVSGPVGIARMVGDAAHFGFSYLLTFVALISINLAVMNLLPFPALDGGRLLFVLIEKIKGSPIPPKTANILNGIGFAFLILLMVVISVHDIIK